MREVIIYTAKQCGFCESAKKFLIQKNISFKTVDLTNDEDLRIKLSQDHNWRTVPMIFFGDDFIGGFRELVDLTAKGLLEEKLNSQDQS